MGLRATLSNPKRVGNLLAVIITAAAILVATATQSYARTGTVHLKIIKAGFFVAAGGGNGVLRYQGKTYPLRIGGVGVGSLGIAAVHLVGTASDLRSPTDIRGTYIAAGAGATLLSGAQFVTLRNDHGVVMRLRGLQSGFQVSLGLAGMTIKMGRRSDELEARRLR